MEIKEKALKLVQEYGMLGLKWKQTEYTTLDLENAKECAIIAVDEILKQRHLNVDSTKKACDILNYWQQVKTEINLIK